MLNKDGVSKVTYGAPRQILANVDLQASVGCIVSQELGVEVGSRKIAKAGTPIAVDFENLQNVVAASQEAVSESATADIGESTGITAASVTASTFGTKVGKIGGTYKFSASEVDSSIVWKLNGETVTLAQYGITPTGTAVDGDTIDVEYVAAKAGIDANAVLLHDVDVTSGNANGTALYFGAVNINRLDTDVQALVTAGVNTIGSVTFLKA